MTATTQPGEPLTTSTTSTAADLAALIIAKHEENFTYSKLEWQLRQGTAVAEEAGEFCGALNRYLGMSRRTGTLEDVAAELSDVVLCAYVAANRLGIDLDTSVQAKYDAMVARGWKDAR
jgi:NTP pyrophosphatase (non-canonical NTP hydrolase)